jgi:hypothetical protein
MEALVKAQKKTGDPQTDIIVQYVMDCWTRGSSLGGCGGQKMWDFQYLLEFTQRLPSSFCNDPKSKEILGRAKYQRGLDHGKSSDKDMGEVVSEFNTATNEFVKLLIAKIKRLEETRWKAGESGNVDKQWKPGTSGNVDKQWKPGTSGSKETQWKPGTSGSKETQWKPGTSGSKETQWKPGTSGSKETGCLGNEQTYESLNALAKALGRDQSGMNKALNVDKKKTPSSSQSVNFTYAGLELVWCKESGEN